MIMKNMYLKMLLVGFTAMLSIGALGQISVANYFNEQASIGVGYDITKKLKTELRLGISNFVNTDLFLTYEFITRENYSIYSGIGTGFYDAIEDYKVSALAGIEIKPFKKEYGLTLHMELQPFYDNIFNKSATGRFYHSWGIRYTFGKAKD